MSEHPETIYLIPGEDGEGPATVWCEDPAPVQGMDPEDAVKYVREDVHLKQLTESQDRVRVLESLQHDFHMEYVNADPSGYYITRWDRAVPAVIRAETLDSAAEKLQAILGKPRSGNTWGIRVKRIEPAQQLRGGGE